MTEAAPAPQAPPPPATAPRRLRLRRNRQAVALGGFAFVETEAQVTREVSIGTPGGTVRQTLVLRDSAGRTAQLQLVNPASVIAAGDRLRLVQIAETKDRRSPVVGIINLSAHNGMIRFEGLPRAVPLRGAVLALLGAALIGALMQLVALLVEPNIVSYVMGLGAIALLGMLAFALGTLFSRARDPAAADAVTAYLERRLQGLARAAAGGPEL